MMHIPGERELLEERTAVLATVESLTDDEFESGRTLCAGWAPRDVLAHLIGVDEAPAEYVRALGNVHKANAVIVEGLRDLSRAELTDRGRRWAALPPLPVRLVSYFLLGDCAVHHQDILRGLGREREIPEASRAAILREGVVLGATKLIHHRVSPIDGGRAIGRGPVVRGTREALGLWMAGRDEVLGELDFAS